MSSNAEFFEDSLGMAPKLRVTILFVFVEYDLENYTAILPYFPRFCWFQRPTDKEQHVIWVGWSAKDLLNFLFRHSNLDAVLLITLGSKNEHEDKEHCPKGTEYQENSKKPFA